mmetsp:Transcript_97864/g.169489  ORF Transcript_97864/g.169489 Transcript_97864/m.169489 type:complete len:255 (+) Transcript_97864:1661-2425(+)
MTDSCDTGSTSSSFPGRGGASTPNASSSSREEVRLRPSAAAASSACLAAAAAAAFFTFSSARTARRLAPKTAAASLTRVPNCTTPFLSGAAPLPPLPCREPKASFRREASSALRFTCGAFCTLPKDTGRNPRMPPSSAGSSTDMASDSSSPPSSIASSALLPGICGPKAARGVGPRCARVCLAVADAAEACSSSESAVPAEAAGSVCPGAGLRPPPYLEDARMAFISSSSESMAAAMLSLRAPCALTPAATSVS